MMGNRYIVACLPTAAYLYRGYDAANKAFFCIKNTAKNTRNDWKAIYVILPSR
jgi:hypothetical protein